MFNPVARIRFRDLWPASWYLRAFLLVGVVETIGDVAIESVLLARFEFFAELFKRGQPDERTALPVYLAIFVLAHIFQIVLAWEAIYNRNVIQIFGLCIFNIAFLAYAIIQIAEIKQAFDNLDDADLNDSSRILVSVIPGIIACAEFAYLYLSWYINRIMGWMTFKTLGANRVLKRMFFWYQVFICILKFDFFFFVAFSLQFVLLVLEQSAIERYLTLAAAPVSLLILYIAWLAVRKENRYLIYAVLALCIAAAGYFIFKIFRIYSMRETSYRLVYKSLTVFSALSFALLVATFATAIICLRQFGCGLKPYLEKQRARPANPVELGDSASSELKLGPHYQLPSANSSRMSID